MKSFDLIVVGGVVVTPRERFRADVAVKDGRIAGLLQPGACSNAEETVDATGLYVLPGLIDSHVHTRYPGNPKRETFATGTCAAAAGGITTILEHPISDPAVHSATVLADRIRACAPQAYVDYAMFGGAGEENIQSIPGLAEAGAIAFKTFLHAAPEGREREFFGLTATSDGAVREILGAVAQTGRLAAVHAESDSVVRYCTSRLRAQGRNTGIRTHHDSRPVIAEIASCASLLELARDAGARLLVCHVSGGSVAAYLRGARERGHHVLVETCPHYLFLDLEDVADMGPYARINPPIRDSQEQKALWTELSRGTIDFIGSDHGPFLKEEKDRGWESIWASPCGAVGLETTVPLLLEAVSANRMRLEDIASLMSENTAREFGIWPRKGSLAVGSDGDLTVVELGPRQKIEKRRMFTKAKETAVMYEGREVRGRVVRTIVRGSTVFENGRIVGREGHGMLITPSSAKKA